jgi:hypothetical protein
MGIGVLDLSIITDRLIALLQEAVDNSPLWTVNGGTIPKFTIELSGSMPESVRDGGGCQVSLYLYHVSPDKHQRNSPAVGPPLVRQRAFGLELCYLLTAFSKKDYVQEQQAMSIALRCMYDNPLVRATGVFEEFTVAMEAVAEDKLSFLWQAVNAPFRLTAVYRVTIAFLEPLQPAPKPQPKPTAFTLTADPADLPFAGSGQLLGSFKRVTYLSPDSTPGNIITLNFDLSPAVAALGEDFTLYGAGLNGPASTQVFLLLPDGSEHEVTTWRSPNAALQTSSRIVLSVPATVGALPGGAPLPGVYQVLVGGGVQRSNATPFSIAAAVTGVTNPPLLAPAGGTFTLDISGLVAGKTEVLLDTAPLVETSGAPAAGQFQVNGGAGNVLFQPPATLEAGRRYPVRVRVNQVESPPSWWIAL